MPSLLTNERMSPELRARIHQSLQGDARSRAGGARALRDGRLFRWLVFLGLVAVGAALTVTFRQSRAEFRVAKAQLLQDYEASVRPFTSDYRARLAQLEDHLRKAREPYAGDWIAPRLKQGGAEALAELLAEPFVAVRGSTRGFRTAEARRSTWGEGGPDSLVRCLILPPQDAKESTLLRHLGHIYQPRVFAGRFVDADPAFAGVVFVDSVYQKQLKAASLMTELNNLRRRLDSAELEKAVPFARVRRLFYVLDEPKVRGAVSDFDGEAEHFVQVGLLDLADGSHSFRLRRRVDPDWLSDESRQQYSRPLDSCRLAYEIRREIAESGRMPQAGEPHGTDNER